MITDAEIEANRLRIIKARSETSARMSELTVEDAIAVEPQSVPVDLGVRPTFVFSREMIEDNHFDIWAQIFEDGESELARLGEAWGIVQEGTSDALEREENQRALDEFWGSRP